MGYAKRFRFGLESYKKKGPIEPPPQLVAQWLRMNPDLFKGEHSASFRRAARNHNRLMNWAIGKSHNELLDAIGRLAWVASYQKSNSKTAGKFADDFKKRLRVARSMLGASKKAHQEAGKKTHEGSPANRAKKAAQEMWSLARWEGWSAKKFKEQLELQGHTLSHSSMARWLTILRQGGTLVAPPNGGD